MSPPDALLLGERRYLEIRPADEPLRPDVIRRSITDLHTTHHGSQSTDADYPTYEFLIAATGSADETGCRSLSWYVGADTDDDRSIEQLLRRCLPDADVVEREVSYAGMLDLPVSGDEAAAASSAEMTTDGGQTSAEHADTTGSDSSIDPNAHTDALVPASDDPAPGENAHDPIGDGDADPNPNSAAERPTDRDPEQQHPEPPLSDHRIAGMSFYGIGNRPADWQCPLEPIDSFAGSETTPGNWPLARILDRLATGDAPALVQLLVRPKRDYTPLVDERRDRVASGEDLLRHWAVNQLIEFLLGPDEPGGGGSRTPPRRRRTASSSRRRDPTATRSPAGRDQPGRRDPGDAAPRRQPSRQPQPGPRGSSQPRYQKQPQARYSSPPSTGTDAVELQASEQRRLDALGEVDASQAFTVNARAVTIDTDVDAAESTLRALTGVVDSLGTRHYRLGSTLHAPGSRSANVVFERLLERDMATRPTLRRHKLPLVPNRSRAIVMGPASLGGLCFTGGPALSSEARRALAVTPPERTGIELPDRQILHRYLDADGMAIGRPRTADRETLEATVSLPPSVQPLHTAVLGASGAGKSALVHWMKFENHLATDGADIFIDHKGDGSPGAYLRAHFAEHRDLEDIYYFDCEELLPALPVLSIEPQVAAGINRLQAIENVIDRHIELLAGYMEPETFHGAPVSVEVIELLLKALFDPVHGDDVTSQYELLHAAARMHHTGEPPAVSDPELTERLNDVTANSDEVFDNVMNGAVRRITKATKDARLRPLFAHAADDTCEKRFDFLEHLDENCIIIFDTSAYRDDPRQLLTLLLISELWTALQRRTKRADPHIELPQVNLYLEEAADVTTSDVLTELLSQGRSFGVGVTVMMQFPEQVRESHPRVYRELINDIGTHITGPVNDPADLTKPFTTSDIPHEQMADRIGELARGEWLVRPAAAFGEERPTPFICESLPLLPGHPDGDRPLSEREESTFQARRTLLETRMSRNHGLEVPATVAAQRSPDDPDGSGRRSYPDSPSQSATEDAATIDSSAIDAITNPIIHCHRLPECLTHLDEPPYSLVCRECETRHPTTAAGMRNAIACCHDRSAVDRDDVPICSLDLSMTATEIRESDATPAQLRLLAAVYMAHQQRFDPDLEYDIVHDSMTRLTAYVGADGDDVDRLLEAGLLTTDCDRPHKLYTVTPAGREAINVGHREGVAHGDGKGDLSESSLHVLMVEAGARDLHRTFVAPADANGAEVRRYLETEDGRLDAAVLDADGDVIATLEAELINNDKQRAIPADFDKTAACDPDEAIWVVKRRDDAHEVLQALNDPLEGPTRVEKSYSDSMQPQRFKIDTPGFTACYTIEHVLNERLDDHPAL